MSTTVQQSLSQLESSVFEPAWYDKPNAWVRQLSSRRFSEIGEALVANLTTGSIVTSSSVGYHVVSGDKRILVRVATRSESGGYHNFLWKGIRPKDPFTHICFVAVMPQDARAFLIDRTLIPQAALRPIKGDAEAFQVTTRDLDRDGWFRDAEIL